MAVLGRLMLTGESGSTHFVLVTARPIMIGRGPTNDLVLADETVSWLHAMVWYEGGRAWIRDLGSRNRTFVNAEPVAAPTTLEDGDRVTLGSAVSLTYTASGAERLAGAAWLVEEVGSGVCYPVRSDRFHIGAGPEADLVLPDVRQQAAVLLLHADGGLSLGVDGAERSLEPDEVFEVGGRALRVLAADADHAATCDAEIFRYPYRLEVSLGRGQGPLAELVCLRSGARHRVDAENRAVLLYMLGQRMLADRDVGVPLVDRGWCPDSEVIVGIWGRGPTDDRAGQYHTLVYRLRQECRKGGFDPWFLEKRRGFTRARLSEVALG